MKYSKPPWKWRVNSHYFNYILMSGTKCILESLSAEEDDECSVGDVLHVNVNGIMRPLYPEHPDAKLIAAAPELLECLKENMNCNLCDSGYARDAMRKAIELIKQLEES